MRHILTTCLLLTLCAPLHAQPTPVDIYVQSRDAKFVGSSMGGMRVTLRDATTGEVLAQGLTAGGTGSTEKIMSRPDPRAGMIDDDAAVFSATLDLTDPTRVEVSAYGPLDYPASANTVTATQLLLPGRGTGDQGWIVELPGLVVDARDVPLRATVSGDDATLPVRVYVAMMCGCPLTPGGLWDADEFQIVARILHDGREVSRAELAYAGTASEFAGAVPLPGPGEHHLLIEANQPRTGNTGAFGQPLLVTPSEH